jgi:FlaA1/EpsC-like NDP-sugar epimerase/dTDP-4-amino-4,6-dideoxygalactose transaminase
MRITMSAPDVSAEDRALVEQVLRSSSLSGGPMVHAFEAEWCERLGGGHAVAVSSGTAGLHLSLIAAGVHPGDFVITSPFSFVASANAALYERAVPIFVDIDPVTFNIDPEAVAQAVHALERGSADARRWLPRAMPAGMSGAAGQVKAIVPVHVFGQPAAMRSICATAARHDLAIVEDACEAIGAAHDGQIAGTFGSAAVFGFYPNKQMTTGEGGMIITPDSEWARLLRSLRNQGRDDDATWLRHVRLGYNYRLDEMSAALGLGQLRRLDDLLASRERVAHGYLDRLKGIEGVTLPQVVAETTRMSWFVFVVRLSPEIDRDAVIAALAAEGIPSKPYFSPIHLQPFYRAQFGYTDGDFPHAEAAGRSTLALPFHGKLTSEELDFIAERVTHAVANCRRPFGRAPSAMPAVPAMPAMAATPAVAATLSATTAATTAVKAATSLTNVTNEDAAVSGALTIHASAPDVARHAVAGRRMDDVAIEALLSRPPFRIDESVARQSIAGRRVLVTGAGGSIGSELCRQIAKLKPRSLVMCDRYENGLHAVATELAALPFVQSVIGDVTDVGRVRALFDRAEPDLVFHAAAHKHVPLMEACPSEAVKNNVTGTRVMAEAAARAGTARFVLVSTDKAVRPSSVMGATKRVAELIVQARAARQANAAAQNNEKTRSAFITVRFGNVLGSNGSVVPAFLAQMRAGGPITITHPDVCRYFMLIPEAVQLMLHAASLTGASKPAHRGTTCVLNLGEPIKIVDLARNLIELTGLVPDVDIPIVFTGLRPGEKLSEELVSDDEDVHQSSIPEIQLVADRHAVDAATLDAAITRLEAHAARSDDAAVVSALCDVVPGFTPGGIWEPVPTT